MKRGFPRGAGLWCLLTLLAFAITFAVVPVAVTQAQDGGVTVVGSGVVAPLLQAGADAAGVPVTVNVTGTNAGFEQFCAAENSADITLATRPISLEEEGICLQNGVNYSELILGHSAIAFVTPPSADLPTCLTTADLNRVFAPSSEGQITNWNQVNTAFPDLPLTVYAPAQDTRAYALLDALIEGVGLRGDVQAGTVGSEVGSISVIDATGQAAMDSANIFEIDAETGAGCAAPTAASIEARTYPAGDRLFAYVNTARLDDESVRALLDTAVGTDAAALAGGAGFVPATDAVYTAGQDIVANQQSGRQFSREVTDFSAPDQVFGQVTLAGSPGLNAYVNALSTAFSDQYPSVTIDAQFLGEPAGYERLCAGQVDGVIAYSEPTAEQQAACDSSDITLVDLPLATDAVVLVGTVSKDYLACLTTDQLSAIWSGSDDAPTTWDQVIPDAAADPLYLFTPPTSNTAGDLLMSSITGVAAPMRLDATERNPDPLYRAAAVANAGSGLTYMPWSDYQTLATANQPGIQLVAVDNGSGCVTPDAATIGDGSYPLSRAYHLHISQAALARPEVQSLLWLAASDASYALFADAGLTGIGFENLPAYRETLQAAFDEAADAAAQAAAAAAEATPEATGEAIDATADEETNEATGDADGDAGEATEEPAG